MWARGSYTDEPPSPIFDRLPVQKLVEGNDPENSSYHFSRESLWLCWNVRARRTLSTSRNFFPKKHETFKRRKQTEISRKCVITAETLSFISVFSSAVVHISESHVCVFWSRFPFFFFLFRCSSWKLRVYFSLQIAAREPNRPQSEFGRHSLCTFHDFSPFWRLRRHRVAQLFIFHQRPFEVRKKTKKKSTIIQ